MMLWAFFEPWREFSAQLHPSALRNAMASPFTTSYHAAGVNTDREAEALQRMVKHLRSTWPSRGLGRVALEIGYFANVLDLGGIGLAMTTDGVGTKVMIAQLMNT